MCTDVHSCRKFARSFSAFVSTILLLLIGCSSKTYHYSQPTYLENPEPGSVLRQIAIDPQLEEKILQIDPNHVSEKDLHEVMAQAPAPRIINIHGGIYPVYLEMESFSQFLIGMGYPESKVRQPADGACSFSCYDSSEKIAGSIPWFYEREGLRPIVIGHSQGGIQAIKVLHELAGDSDRKLPVWNPVTQKYEKRDWILDPVTGAKIPVVGGPAKICYTTAVTAGGLTRLMPNQWSMMLKLRTIPDSTLTFTGFYFGFDLLGGDALGFADGDYRPKNQANVRNVALPGYYNHYFVIRTAHLKDYPETRRWINEEYVPGPHPDFQARLPGSTANILWAADVWTSIKRNWVLELQRVILARRSLLDAEGR